MVGRSIHSYTYEEDHRLITRVNGLYPSNDLVRCIHYDDSNNGYNTIEGRVFGI